MASISYGGMAFFITCDNQDQVRRVFDEIPSFLCEKLEVRRRPNQVLLVVPDNSPHKEALLGRLKTLLAMFGQKEDEEFEPVAYVLSPSL